MSERKNRLDYIDRAKGILIILVVTGHIWQYGFVHSCIYKFHMASFFLISGYLLSLTRSFERGYGRFAAKRAFAFLMPYLFMEVLGVAHNIMRNGVQLNWKGYLFNTLSLRTNDMDVWFLRTLLVIELLFPLLLRVLKKRDLVLLAACGMCGASLFIAPKSLYVEILCNILLYFLPFSVGFYFGKNFSVRKLMLLPFALVLVLFAGYMDWKSLALPGPIIRCFRIIAGFGGAYLVIQLSRCIDKPVSSVLDHFGKNSIIVYCTHHILYTVIGLLIGYMDFSTIPFLPGLLILLAVLILEFPIIYCFNRWLPFLVGRHYKDRAKFMRLPA